MKRFGSGVLLFFLIVSNVLIAIEEGRAEELTSTQEARDLLERSAEKLAEARKELNAAERAKKEAEAVGDKEAVEESETKIAYAKIKQAEANRAAADASIFLTQESLRTDPNNEQLKNRLATVQSSREKAVFQLDELTRGLAGEYQGPVTYQQSLEDKFAEIPEEQKPAAFFKELFDIMKQYTDYNQQLKNLQQLQDIITKSDVTIKDEILDTVDRRIKQIQDAIDTGWDVQEELKMVDVSLQTSFEKEQNLPSKIPADQIDILKKDLDTIDQSIDKLLKNKVTDKNIDFALSHLNDLYITIEHRNFLNRTDVSQAVTNDAKAIQDRIVELENKLVNPILKDITDETSSVAKAVSENIDKATIDENLKKLSGLKSRLEEIKKKLSQIEIKNPDLYTGLDDLESLVTSIKDPTPPEPSPQVKAIEPDIKEIVAKITTTEIILEKEEPGFFTKLKNFVSLKVEKVKEGIASAIDSVAVKLVTKFSKLRDIATMIKEYTTIIQENPNSIKTVADVVQMTQESDLFQMGTAKVQAVAKDPRLDAFVEALKRSAPVLKFVTEHETLTKFVLSGVQKSADVLIGVANAGSRLGTLLSGKVKTLAEVQEIENIILKERIKIYKRPLTTAEAVATFIQQPTAEKINTIIKKANSVTDALYSYFKDSFDNLVNWAQGRDKYAGITNDYNGAVKDFNANSSPENAKKVVDALKQIAIEYQKVYQQQDLTNETLNFLVSAWDRYTFDDKVAAKDLVQDFFNTRNKKLFYLQKVRDAIDRLNVDLKKLSADPKVDENLVERLQAYIDSLNNSVSQSMITEILNYSEYTDGLSKQLDAIKTQIQEKSDQPVAEL